MPGPMVVLIQTIGKIIRAAVSMSFIETDVLGLLLDISGFRFEDGCCELRYGSGMGYKVT